MRDLVLSRRSRAFTLIELLVVIVILGILMAVAVPTFLSQQTKAQDSRTQQYLTTAFKAIRSSTVGENSYPSSTSMVSWITQSEPELKAASGDCINAITSAPQDEILVDPSSTSNSLQLCSRSQSGNVWKLTASATGVQQLLDGTLIPFTFTGDEITDATRAANVQGDGLSNDSSTGVWEQSSNLVKNGGFEVNAANWGVNPSPATTITQDTSTSKFGSASGLCATDGVANHGCYPLGGMTIGASSKFIPVTTGLPYTSSAWLWAASSISINIRIEWYDNTGTMIASAETPVSVTSTPTRYSSTAVAPANAVAAVAAFYTVTGTSTPFHIDGAQFEQKFFATPYIETSGSTAIRTNGYIEAPSSLLNSSQGWVAVRLHMGFAPSADTTDFRGVFSWRNAAMDGYSVQWRPSNPYWKISYQLAGTEMTQADFAAASYSSTGDPVTVVGYWKQSGGSTTIGISVNGAPFQTATQASKITAPLTDLYVGSLSAGGQIDSNIMWAAFGAGTLADADSATINSWGDSDPSRSQFPAGAQATAVWNGASASGSLK